LAAALSSGRFFGEVTGPRETAALRLSEVRHASRRALPEHTHERPLLTVLLAGEYHEEDRRGTIGWKPLCVGWRPAGQPHLDAIGTTGARFFAVEMGEDWTSQLEPTTAGEPRHEDGSGELLWLCLRLLREHRSFGETSSLVMESAAAEIVGALNRAPTRTPIPWIRRVEDRLRSEFPSRVSLAALASDVRAHPVALARAFRRAHGLSIGDYLQRERIRHACALLLAGDVPLIDLALHCGFSDQSHFTRVFRRVAGNTPAAFRRLAGKRH
jgi:AraC family transcriptional regulator